MDGGTGFNADNVDHYIGQQMKRRRKELGITQEKLGQMVFLSRSVINKMELGKREASFEEIKLLSVALKCTPNDFCSPDMSDELKQYYTVKMSIKAKQFSENLDLSSFISLFEYLENMK